ncbi:MAG: hypothetical protein Alpg2KO_03920 [Alphaproteobacteria bacterium]
MVLPDWSRVDVTLDGAFDLPDPGYSVLQIEVREFIRICGLLPVVAHRQDWVIAMSGAMMLREMLIRQMKRAEGGPAGGMLSLRRQISAEDYDTLCALPELRPDRNAVLDIHAALIARYIPAMAEYFDDKSEVWPTDFAKATQAHLQDRLGVDWEFLSVLESH